MMSASGEVMSIGIKGSVKRTNGIMTKGMWWDGVREIGIREQADLGVVGDNRVVLNEASAG